MTTRMASGTLVGETVPDEAALEQRFLELAETWRFETQCLAFWAYMVDHDAYREIVAMGDVAVPWILRELERDCAPWFLALADITGENPAAETTPGKVDETVAAWLEWGQRRFPDK